MGFWAWKRGRIRLEWGGEDGDAESAMAKKGDLGGSARSSEERRKSEKAVEASSASLYEMPAYLLSRAELNDAEYREMEGDGGRRELVGDEAAVEVPDTESRRNSLQSQ